jgi:unsaturated rhamnogalacturonyl hydrolase
MKSIVKKISICCCLLLFVALSKAEAQKKVMLDNFYNNETQPITGKSFHYLWSDEANSGFSQFGEMFKAKGAQISTLVSEPEETNLQEVDIYIIVDPDTKDETKYPNFMSAKSADVIAKWVEKGGVLLVLANDYKNAELDSFNILARKFGMEFNKVQLHPVKNRNWEMGASINLPEHPIFKNVKKIYLKEIASIACTQNARPVLTEQNSVLMAECSYGKGYVFAVGDPWIYNEYIGNKLLPTDFENSKAAQNLVDFLLSR